VGTDDDIPPVDEYGVKVDCSFATLIWRAKET
jgi:hypothetical protein